jgi:hypothetical protein
VAILRRPTIVASTHWELHKKDLDDHENRKRSLKSDLSHNLTQFHLNINENQCGLITLIGHKDSHCGIQTYALASVYLTTLRLFLEPLIEPATTLDGLLIQWIAISSFLVSCKLGTFLSCGFPVMIMLGALMHVLSAGNGIYFQSKTVSLMCNLLLYIDNRSPFVVVLINAVFLTSILAS